MAGLAHRACLRGFKGLGEWTWDTWEQSARIWTMLDGGGAIRDALLGLPVRERDWVVVVGVVRHVQYHSLTTSVRPQIYVPFQLAPRPVSFVVRASPVA